MNPKFRIFSFVVALIMVLSGLFATFNTVQACGGGSDGNGGAGKCPTKTPKPTQPPCKTATPVPTKPSQPTPTAPNPEESATPTRAALTPIATGTPNTEKPVYWVKVRPVAGCGARYETVTIETNGPVDSVMWDGMPGGKEESYDRAKYEGKKVEVKVTFLNNASAIVDGFTVTGPETGCDQPVSFALAAQPTPARTGPSSDQKSLPMWPLIPASLFIVVVYAVKKAKRNA